MKPLSADKLRWSCPLDTLPFETTADLDPVEGVVGQDRAVEALSFGLDFHAPKQHIFVRGQEGTGRLTLVKRLLADPGKLPKDAPDLAYVVDFEQLDRPALLSLPPGRAHALKLEMSTFSKWVTKEFHNSIVAAMSGIKADIEARSTDELKAISVPFEEELATQGLQLVQIDEEDGSTETAVLPVHNGQPLTLDDLAEKVQQGEVAEEVFVTAHARVEAYQPALRKMVDALQQLQKRHESSIEDATAEVGRKLLTEKIGKLKRRFKAAARFLTDGLNYLVDHLEHLEEHADELARPFEVNVVLARKRGQKRPVIVDSAPSLVGLLGSIDMPIQEGTPPHMGIRSGSLLQADGGYLVLDARTLVRQEGAWESLSRTLRSGELQLMPDDGPTTLRPPGIKPAPIPIDVKVVLLGDDAIYYALDQGDPDFPNLFKILADFDPTIPISKDSIGFYAAVVTGVSERSSLPPFHREAVAALVEQGARIASEEGYLTARFGRIADTAREAAWLAKGQVVQRAHVDEAARRAVRRADGPGASFRKRIANGSVRILTEGTAVGEINGLAVIASGQVAYGMPVRITASVGPGTGGAVNVEQEALLSGQIHVKSFHILMGLLRRVVDASHPLTFDASIAFEQSYGGIDGDSASGASFCVLLSALTGLPVRQDLAMTGAIDQVGNVLPIGAVNEKIEGFYDVCREIGPLKDHGVIIPSANTGDLMLRQDLVEGGVQIYPIDRIEQAVELFFRRPAEEVFELTRATLQEFWGAVEGGGGAKTKTTLERRLRRVALASMDE